MIYAVLEGLSYGYRELAAAMQLNLKKCSAVKIVGGGARSTAWAQTLANVLNVKVEQMDGVVNPAFGIALLAAFHCGYGATLRDVADGSLKVKQVFAPDPDMPNLPVARVTWKPEPSLTTGLECWITAGGAHHTVLSYDVTAEQMREWAAMMDIEFVHIGKETTPEKLEDELFLKDLAWKLR